MLNFTANSFVFPDLHIPSNAIAEQYQQRYPNIINSCRDCYRISLENAHIKDIYIDAIYQNGSDDDSRFNEIVFLTISLERITIHKDLYKIAEQIFRTIMRQCCIVFKYSYRNQILSKIAVCSVNAGRRDIEQNIIDELIVTNWIYETGNISEIQSCITTINQILQNTEESKTMYADIKDALSEIKSYRQFGTREEYISNNISRQKLDNIISYIATCEPSELTLSTDMNSVVQENVIALNYGDRLLYEKLSVWRALNLLGVPRTILDRQNIIDFEDLSLRVDDFCNDRVITVDQFTNGSLSPYDLRFAATTQKEEIERQNHIASEYRQQEEFDNAIDSSVTSRPYTMSNEDKSALIQEAEKGNHIAQYKLATYYKQGICGFEQNDDKYIFYLQKATKGSDTKILEELSEYYFTHKEIEKAIDCMADFYKRNEPLCIKCDFINNLYNQNKLTKVDLMQISEYLLSKVRNSYFFRTFYNALKHSVQWINDIEDRISRVQEQSLHTIPVSGTASQKEYLAKFCYEKMPAWLAEFDGTSDINLSDFFSSRNVFYPGSGTDAHPIEIFGGSHSAHCFVYADYLISKNELLSELKNNLIPGYSIFYQKEYEVSSLFNLFQDSYSFIPKGKVSSIASARDTICPDITPYLYFTIFKRNSDLEDSYGAERIALLFCGTDVFPIFDKVYANGNSELFGMLVEDYEFGLQYEGFGRNSLLNHIADNAGIYPEFLLAKETCVWSGYSLISDLGSEGGMYSQKRYLYEKRG